MGTDAAARLPRRRTWTVRTDTRETVTPRSCAHRDLEARVTELEQRVVTLAAAVDAASRMRVATPFRVNEDIRIAGGRLVRRILEKGSLVADYRGAGRTE